MKEKRIISLLLCFITCNSIYSIPAYPKRIPLVMSGDTVYIQLHGDENCKYATDDWGYTLLPTDEGWVYAAEDEDGLASFTDIPLSSPRERDARTISFLQKTRKGIPPKSIVTSNKSESREEETMAHVPAIGSRRVLVVLMEFKDKSLTKSASDFQKLFNEENYHEDGAIGSVRDYYRWASYGQLNLQCDVLGPYTSKYMMSYYGGNSGVSGGDKNPYALFDEAIHHAIEEVNLSEYDADGDGYVDNIHIIYAGYGEEAGASANAIWAHEMTFRAITVQGMKIDRYSCAPELRGNKGNGISRIGPHCHEIGHALGAMDYYDTDYATGGSYQGTGQWDIMASGSWNNDGISPADFNPYVKVYNYGWTEAKTLNNNAENTIGISSEEGNIYRVNTGTNLDFFLLENRNHDYFHSAEPGKGLLIFHIGPNLKTRASTNTINSTFPQQCYVVCASSTSKRPSATSSTYGNINSNGCPYPGSSNNTEFSDTSTPAALTFAGKSSGINISNIHFNGQNISFIYGNSNGGEQEEPTQDNTYLWAEDFEQLRLPSSWTYEDSIGNGKMEVISKLSEVGTIQSPTAESGKGYARYTAIPQVVFGAYRTSGLLKSPRIKLNDDNSYILCFSARKYNKGKSKDSIIVTLYDEQMEKDYKLLLANVEEQEKWSKYSAVIPTGYYDFSVGFLCDIDYGSTLFIDNIRIENNIGDQMPIRPQTSDISVQPYRAYTIYGTQYQSKTKGLAIIRDPHGNTHKVFVK